MRLETSGYQKFSKWYNHWVQNKKLFISVFLQSVKLLSLI